VDHDVLPVSGDRALATLVLVEVSVEQLVNRRRCAGVAKFLDLREEATPNLIGLIPVPSARLGSRQRGHSAAW
jgi:hypothetical protein